LFDFRRGRNSREISEEPGDCHVYAASNMYLPDDDIAVVVLSNVEDTNTNGIARHLATLALES
jgi:hypothetical protein